jgi:hypothetical protein
MTRARDIADLAGGGTLLTRQLFTATAGQTTFTPSAGYNPGALEVFMNGLMLLASDYTATNSSTVVLGVAANAGDEVEILTYQINTIGDTVSASSGGTFNNDITVNGAIDATGVATFDNKLVIPSGNTDPTSSLEAGQMFFNVVDKALLIHDGSHFVRMALALDGSTAGAAAASAVDIYNLGITTNGMYWLNLDGTARQYYCDMANGGWILFSQYNENGSATSYATAQGGYANAPTTAVASPGSSNDLYNSYGSLYGNLSASSAWSMNGPMQQWNDSEMGEVWSRQDGNTSGSMRYYRPNNYGYNWSSIKFGFKIATCGSLDGWRNVAAYTGIDQPSCEGVQLFHGNTASRSHIFSYALANSGGGGTHQGTVPSYVGASDYVALTHTTIGQATNFAEVSRTLSSGTTIPPEMRIGTDQEARVNASGNENAGLKAWYIFLK